MDTSEQGGAESDDAEHPHEKRVFRSWFLIALGFGVRTLLLGSRMPYELE